MLPSVHRSSTSITVGTKEEGNLVTGYGKCTQKSMNKPSNTLFVSGSCNLVNTIIEDPNITSPYLLDLPECRDFCKDQGAKYFSYKATGTAGKCICGNKTKLVEEMDPPRNSG